MSPTMKARQKSKTKHDFEEMIQNQFPIKVTKETSLYDRAIKIYEMRKKTKGINRRDIGKPNEVFHAHIETMEDNIDIQRYDFER